MMSNLQTKNCDHKTCEKLYATDSNNWWWAARKNQVVLFGMFNTSITVADKNDLAGVTVDKDSILVMHFCGQEHLMSWVNENVGRINDSQQRAATESTK